jgi:hypothetical protein
MMILPTLQADLPTARPTLRCRRERADRSIVIGPAISAKRCAMARAAFGLTPLGIDPALLCVRAQRGLSLRERGQLPHFRAAADKDLDGPGKAWCRHDMRPLV